jgi:hypothetical protein
MRAIFLVLIVAVVALIVAIQTLKVERGSANLNVPVLEVRPPAGNQPAAPTTDSTN